MDKKTQMTLIKRDVVLVVTVAAVGGIAYAIGYKHAISLAKDTIGNMENYIDHLGGGLEGFGKFLEQTNK